MHKTVAILIEKNGKVLLAKRANKTWHGFWCVPGGHVEEGESIHEAALREAQEEVGSVIIEPKPFMIFVHSVPAGERRNPGPHKHTCHVFKGVVEKVRAGGDVAEVKWFKIQQIKKLKLTSYTKKILNILQQRQKYLNTKIPLIKQLK
ncbi:MAG: NUDIX hydrolase [Candidatus Aenigmatarchaeota archaeon]